MANMNELEEIQKLLHKHQYVISIHLCEDQVGCIVKYPYSLRRPAYETEYRPIYPDILIIREDNNERTITLPVYAIKPYINFHIIKQCARMQYNVLLLEHYHRDQLTTPATFDECLKWVEAPDNNYLDQEEVLARWLINSTILKKTSESMPDEIMAGYEIIMQMIRN